MLNRIVGYLLGIAANEALDATLYSGEEAKDATLLEVVDGDTLRFASWRKPCRLAGVDTPELDGPDPGEAFAAKAVVEGWLETADQLHVEQVGRGHYGRPVVRVRVLEDGRWYDLSERIREEGLG